MNYLSLIVAIAIAGILVAIVIPNIGSMANHFSRRHAHTGLQDGRGGDAW